MKKMIYIDAQEIEQYHKIITQLRNETEKLRKDVLNLKKEIDFLKDSGSNILVIVKDLNNDVYEYKSNEKELLNKLVNENKEVREKYDNILRERDNVENQKQMMILKYHETVNQFNDKIKDLKKYILFLEKRNLKDRIFNKIKNIDNIEINNIQINDENDEPIKTIYSEKEILRLENEAKKIKKPRGWHFKDEFIDSEGNVYHKGKLQPHLKKLKK